jgi:hypothetical protein
VRLFTPDFKFGTAQMTLETPTETVLADDGGDGDEPSSREISVTNPTRRGILRLPMEILLQIERLIAEDGPTRPAILRLPIEILLRIERLLVEDEEDEEQGDGSDDVTGREVSDSIVDADSDDAANNEDGDDDQEEADEGEDEDDENKDDRDYEPDDDEESDAEDDEDDENEDADEGDDDYDSDAEKEAGEKRRARETNLISVLCLALTCRRFWQLFGGSERVRKAKALHCPVNWSPANSTPSPTRSIILLSKWWALLKRMQDSRWRCCAGCFVLHPVREFPKSQLQVPADRRTCIFGPLVGVVDFCPCFRMTFRKKAKLVKRLLVGQETGQVPVDHTITAIVHECYAERWSDDDPRARRSPYGTLFDRHLYEELFRNTAERAEKNFSHGSAFVIPELGPVPSRYSGNLGDPDAWCYACSCEDGQRTNRRFSAVLDSAGNMSVITEVDLDSRWHEDEDYYDWTPLLGQLQHHPVPICPHRTLYQLTRLIYAIVCDRVGYEYDWQEVNERTALKILRPLMRCEYCGTRVEEFTTKRWAGGGPCRVHVRTVRDLGKAVDRADETWFSQTAFCSEGLDIEEQKERNPWRPRIQRVQRRR